MNCVMSTMGMGVALVRRVRLMRALLVLPSVAGVLALASTETEAIQVYFNDFDAPAVVASGVTAVFDGAGAPESVASYPAPFSGNFFRNTTGGTPTGTPGLPTTLTLSGLPAHTSLDINLLLAAIDSWDSSDGAPAPDVFNVVVDGTNVFQGTWANASGSINTVPSFAGPAPLCCTSGGPFFDNDRGIDLGPVSSLSAIPHTASTVSIAFFADGAGWQGGTDESWAMDNLQVIVNGANVTAVPAPAPLLLLGSALMGVAVLHAARRRA